jgi:DNA-binding PadR family transcriptional regulator
MTAIGYPDDLRGRLVFFGGRGHGHGRRRRGNLGYGPPFFRGARRGRGDIRAAILALLTEEPMHGYQIIRELTERSGGVWRPSPGSVYPTLQQLEDEDLVREQRPESGRRTYERTDAAREAAAALPEGKPWEQAGEDVGDDAVALHDLVGQVMGATRQVLHAGTPDQVKAAQEVLRETRKRLYQILADDA